MNPDVQFLSEMQIRGYGTTEMRCIQPADYLRSAGWQVECANVYQRAPRAQKAIVFHRVVGDAFTIRAMQLARNRGCLVVYDIDDLLFTDAAISHLEKFSDGLAAARQVTKYQRAIAMADVVSCSTGFLKEQASAYNSHCVVMPNGVSTKLLATASASAGSVPRDSDLVSIGYFSGSSHHDNDFAVLQPALLKLLGTHLNVKVLLAGKLNFDPAFTEFGNRFDFRAFTPYRDFMSVLGAVDINVAPLEVTDPFAQARSELKFTEAGAFGIPTIASPTPAYSNAINHGANGLLCGANEWYESLCELVENTELRRRLGAAARQDVLNGYSPECRGKEWSNLLRHRPRQRLPSSNPLAAIFQRSSHSMDILQRRIKAPIKQLRRRLAWR